MKNGTILRWLSAAAFLSLATVLVAGSGNLNDAKEKAKLIEQGQMNLRDAAAMAEQHVKGMALEISSRIDQAVPGPRGREPTDNLQQEPPTGPKDSPVLPPATGQDETNKRLVYQVSCFAQDRVQNVMVDGLAKKVIEDVKELEGSRKPK